jgi:chemotaxis protein histidine kinase CheA
MTLNPRHKPPQATHKPDQKAAQPPRARLRLVQGHEPAPDHRDGPVSRQGEADHIPAENLRRAAMAPSRPLPHRPALERLFGRDLSAVQTRQGPEVTAALDESGAEAAMAGQVLLLRDGAALPVVAHEVTHLLQSRNAPAAAAQAAEAEALHAEAAAADRAPIAAPAAALPADAVALRSGTASVTPAVPPGRAQDDFRSAGTGAPVPANVAPAPATAPVPATASAQSAPSTADAPATTASSATPIPTFAPAEAPALEVDAASAAAARASADAALAQASDADEVMAAMAAAPPSVKARQAAGLGARLDAAQASEQNVFNAALPPLSAEMSGDQAAPAPATLTLPPPPAPLTEPVPAAAPPPTVDPTPPAQRAQVSAGQATRGLVPGDAAALGQAIASLPTADTAVDTSAGQRPAVPQTGATDPSRPATQAALAATEAETARAAAAGAVANGPGPEQAQMRALREDLPAPQPAPVAFAPAAPAEGAAAFAAMPLDAETTALFDRAHGPAMQASLQGAQDQLATAQTDRDTGRDREVQVAQTETARLNAEADVAQQAEVTTRRTEIQDARQTAVTAQTEAVAELDATATTEATTTRASIDTESTRTETAVSEAFTAAETEAEAEVAAGNARAETTRDTAETEAEDQSWWDRATDWIAAQFERLAAAIGAIFDAVRAAVRSIIDAAKTAALALIDLAARAITAVIDAYASLLRGLVNALLADIFPTLAAALTAAIDAAVELAHRAIDAIATALKAGVSLLLDALAAGLDAVLAAWAAAVNGVLALVQAALTGDWRALARLILTPILLALGIPPDGFFALMGRAETAIDTIVANPQGFVANLLESVKGGFGLFRDNFLHHLIAGVILWLTGPLGNAIQMPQQFDLWGLLDIARQLVGLTLAMLRRVAVRVIGATAVQRIEFVMNYIGAAIRDGWNGLWTQLTQDLGQLRDMVLDQIKTFLVENVVIATIMWLASMFNPVGALVKLVMTIWNFLKFLREQVARIYPIVELVINSVADIAAGALAGPMRGVERILGRMVPMVIDLFMTLLGVTGVPDRVQTILRGVQERVEAATEALMRRVLALFGVTGAGGAAAAPGQIMAPIAFTAGAEAHTILIEDEGETVRPIIRSTPTPLVTWLDGRMGAPFTELATGKGWTGDTLAQKRTEAQGLVTAAKTAETALDSSAEATENAINTASPTTATDAQKAAATAAQADTATKGQTAKSAIVAVLEFWGIRVEELSVKYARDVARLSGPVRTSVLDILFPALEPARYAPLDWPAFREQMQTDRAAPDAWRNPANASGVAGGLPDFAMDFLTRARTVAEAMDPATKANFLERFTPTAEAASAFGNPHLAGRLNGTTARAAVLSHLLSNPAASAASLAGLAGLNAPIRGAIEDALRAGGSDSHDFAFNKVTGSWYSGTLVTQFRAQISQTAWGSYFHDDAANGAGSGAGAPQGMAFFLAHDATGQRGSRRAQKNRERLADAVRGAGDHEHEWIASRYAANIVTRAADELTASGGTSKLEGLSELIQFQHRVRVPTKNILFDPAPPSGAAMGFVAPMVTIRWRSPEHRASALWKDTAPEALPTDARRTLYPEDSLQPGATIGILQGHPGAIYARVRGSEPSTDVVQQTQGHTTWDNRLETVVNAALGDGVVTATEMHALGRALLGYYDDTVWHGNTDPAGLARLYPEYSTSGGTGLQYDAVKGEFAARFSDKYNRLTVEILSVETA